MKYGLKYFLFFLFSLLALFVKAQNESEVISTNAGHKQYYFLNPRLSVTVPRPIGNKSFKKSFAGVYEISGGLNLFLFRGLFVGVTAKTGLLRITENRIPDYNANMTFHNIGFKVGNDWYGGNKNNVVYSLALSVGQNQTSYSSLKHKDETPVNKSFKTSYTEPEMDIYFMVEPNVFIGASVSYTIFDDHFDPYELALNEFSSFDSHNGVSTQWLSFGFGVYCNLIKKKK
jgi:hypothetical protein